jgi:hypothetical protein
MGYIFGLDLGQAQDYSALVLVERTPPRLDEAPFKVPVKIPASYAVRYVHRWQLGTDYVQVVHDVAHRLARSPVEGQAALVVDRTGIGQAVVDMVRKAGLKPMAVHVHGGAVVTTGNWVYNVPKRDLVGVVQVLLQQERLVFPRAMPLMGPLFRELQSFRAKIDPETAHDSYSAWREQDHDDLVFALALALWWGEWWAERKAVELAYLV